MQLVGRPKLAKPLPKALPRSAVEALLDTIAPDRESKRQTDWAERDLALILTALLGRLACGGTQPGQCDRPGKANQSTLETAKNQSRLSQHGTHSIPLRVTNVLLTEALKGIGAADNKLLQEHTEADHHNPSSPDAA